MKIIDEKGRLFSSINIIDLLVILFIVAIGGVVLMKINFMNKVNLLEDKKAYEIKVLVKAILPEMAEQVKVKDIIFEDALNAEIGEVTNVETDVTKNEIPTDDGRVVSAEVVTRRDVTITIKGMGQFDKQKGLMLGNRDWQAGGSIVIKSSKIKFAGTIYNIEVKE
ncbi:MAG TPA: hypothetical protein DCP90_05145 [Clostridiales bacterium]|nr:MAG: hypothetical protein A2Y22_09060 [Clostridiales bacterium GWD2_32_59]HAN09985.1 hypothetical protein [Clostridiales bacterium]